MVFTEQEINRLNELAAWGLNKGIQDEDLKKAQNKLKRLLYLHNNVSVVIEDKDHPYDPSARPSTLEKTITFLEKLLGRAVIPNESQLVLRFINAGASYEQIRYALLEAMKAMGSPNLVYAEKVLEKELQSGKS